MSLLDKHEKRLLRDHAKIQRKIRRLARRQARIFPRVDPEINRKLLAAYRLNDVIEEAIEQMNAKYAREIAEIICELFKGIGE